MAKVGMGKVASDLQSGQAPTAAESTRDTLSKALGDMVNGMEIPEVETPASGLPTAPVYSEGAGFTPEGDLLPLDERAQLADQNMMNPEFADWQDAGVQRYQAEQAGTTVTPEFTTPSRDDTVNMMARAEHFSKQIDKAQNPEAFSINWHPKSSVRDDYVNINKRIATSTSLAEKTSLMESRDALLKNQGETENTLAQTINTKLRAVVSDPNTGMTSIDPDFGKVASMATENALDGAFMGAKEDPEDMENPFTADERGNAVPVDKVNPADLATNTGREVHKWWSAEKKARGEPIDESITDQEAKDLGAATLMTYAGSFPNLMEVDYVKGGRDKDGNPNAEGMRFVLTDRGQRQMELNRGTRTRMFDTRINPSRTPKPAGLEGDSASEKPAFRKRREIESDDKAYASLEQVEESIANQNGVNHVVDARRSRIALAMLLPTLYGQIGDPNNRFSDAFGLGSISLETTIKEQTDVKGMAADKAQNFAMNVMQSKKKSTAREVKAIADNFGVPNYLTFGIQPMTARTMVQQTDFNPTRNKLVRFVTRSAHPAVIKSMSGRLYENYMNILALSFGKDDMLPKGRMADLKENTPRYRAWGKSLKDNLDKAFPTDMFNQGMAAIQSGQKVPDPSAQLLQFQRGLDPALMDFLTKKGEDAPMAIDALIDFADFMDNMEQGRPHKTSLNAYVDGKTNGIANQGMMLGIKNLATKVGALRNADAATALDDGDIRQAMADLISDRLDNGTIPVIPMEQLQDGRDMILMDVLRGLGNAKPINKAISMIFPYGKEIAGMKGEIANKLPEVRANDSVLDSQIEELVNSGIPLDDIISAAHENVVYSLFEIFGEDTFKTRSIMRHVGFLHALTDDLFSIKGPIGHRINLGDRRIDPKTTQTTRVTVGGTAQERNPKTTMKLNVSDQYLSSAATRPTGRDPRGEAAGHVRGRAAVIPTQSMDSAVVIRTSTGKSWEKLKAAHPANDPYFFQIYDAFKVDVHNYDVIAGETNQNWLDITTRDWSFLAEAEKELNSLESDFENRMNANPGREHSLADDGTFSYLGRLMDPETRRNADGKEIHQRSTAKAFAASVFPIDPDGNFMGRTDYKRGSSRAAPSEVMDNYNNFLNDQAGIIQGVIVNAINGVGRQRLKVGQVPDSINSEEALAVFKAITTYSHSKARLSALAKRTQSNRSQLREEVMAQKRKTGFGALQYWAH